MTDSHTTSNNDSLSLNLSSGDNSSPANPIGSNGSPLVASKMANYYYASARSNYFRVKDKDAFMNDIDRIMSGITVDKEETDGKEYYVLLFKEDIPWCWFDDEDSEIEIDWAAFFAKHLEEDSVAILMEVGAEKLCYLSGYAYAYNAKGKELIVSLLDIYDLIASKWGTDLEATPTEY